MYDAAVPKVYICPRLQETAGSGWSGWQGFSRRMGPRGEVAAPRERTGTAGEVLTVKQTASIDHVCALHQRLRSPLIPFRNGETSLVGRGWSPEILNMQTTGKIQCRGSEREKKATAIGTVLSSALAGSHPPLLSHRREASISTMTLSSHPGADRHHEHCRRQHPPPLHHRRRRSCQEDAAGSRRAGGCRHGANPGAPNAGTRSGPGG